MDTYPNSIDVALLERYLANELKPASRADVERWLAADTRRQDVIQALRVGREGGARLDARLELTRFWQQRAPTSLPEQGARAGRGSRDDVRVLGIRGGREMSVLGKRTLPMYMAFAAILAVVAGLTFIDTSAPASPMTYATSTGERAHLTLANGTRVTLAPVTTLSIRDNVVTLVGQAAFSVPHQVKSSLQVRTGRVWTRVLGTTFDVRRYATDTVTQVFVLEGKVVTGGSRTATLTSHMVANVTDSTVTATPVDDVSVLSGWTKGRLVFRNTPTAEVLATVGRWYGVTFQLTDSKIGRYPLTVSFDAQWSRSDVYAALETILDVQMAARGDTVIVSKRRAQRTPGQEPRSAPPRHEAGKPFSSTMDIGR
jgi:transmembrane sensor